MKDRQHQTDIFCTYKPVAIGPQKTHWVEFQLVDELGEPLANLPWRATNQAVRDGCVAEYSGSTDAEGVIRLEDLHPIDVTLLMPAAPLAEVLQQRRLRAVRPEPERPGASDSKPLYGKQRPGFSPVEKQALEQGHAYHYLRIGQLCDELPAFNPPWPELDPPPAYHFPDAEFSGFTVQYEALNCRHVLEVCPLRAWSLVLHDEQKYSLANAYNLGLMSILSYSNRAENLYGSPEYFFAEQCLDLSRTPRVWDGGKNWPCLVTDVSFNDRYASCVKMNTATAVPPHGDTQLFSVVNATQVLVAWRGTDFDRLHAPDLATDLTFRPVLPEVKAGCAPSIPCVDIALEGRVHLGFQEAFKAVQAVYGRRFEKELPYSTIGKQLFICGHSLGGALGLIHAASLRAHNPLLYTYGMPRTFTLAALKALSEIRHFRHVNDTDTIPSVPPEADLDNHLYRLYGPLGTTLGFAWSMGQALATNVIEFGDSYGHHGELAMFYRVEQHIQSRGSSYPAYRNKDGLGAPYYNTIKTRLPVRSNLYLVPSINKTLSEKSGKLQHLFISSLDKKTLERIFPRYKNPKPGGLLGIGNHMMGEYMAHITHRLLTAIEPDRKPPLDAQDEIKRFAEQMTKHGGTSPKDEYERNDLFLKMHKQLEAALEATVQSEGGVEALQRLGAVTKSSGV
ncbi:lipase family protein [Pseudomonas sp. NPDC078416]|uniref:lipase family protein n=1 Tax=Pseudomonas sp. NPDC078416 TaxID=3390637 RepID=UPI003D00A1CE